MEIWDTAGQEQFRALAQAFYRNTDVCILVYDVTNKYTFEEIKNYWIKDIKENNNDNISKKIIIILFHKEKTNINFNFKDILILK